MELVLLGKNPIGNEKPAGQDVREDADYDTLQVEVEKAVSGLSQDSDWKKVMELASAILETKSKNLLVAGYLAVSLIHLKKAEGLKMGTHIYLDMIETYWDDLYPLKAKQRARMRAIEWWVEKSSNAATIIKNQSISKEDGDSLLARLEKAENFNGQLNRGSFFSKYSKSAFRTDIHLRCLFAFINGDSCCFLKWGTESGFAKGD